MPPVTPQSIQLRVFQCLPPRVWLPLQQPFCLPPAGSKPREGVPWVRKDPIFQLAPSPLELSLVKLLSHVVPKPSALSSSGHIDESERILNRTDYHEPPGRCR